MSEVDKLLKKQKDLEKTIKKAMGELNKKPADPKLVKAVQTAMISWKDLPKDYDAAEKADRKVFDDALKTFG